MISIAHIINPVKVDPASDLYVAQPVTFATMRAAREFSRGTVDVTLLSAQYAEDRDIVPDDFIKTPDLEDSVARVGPFRVPRKLPFIRDILDRLYDHGKADYLVYTNADIALQPYFYSTVAKIAAQGYDAFTITRRTIPAHYSKIEEIPAMYAEVGEKHKGYDCFVFKRDAYPKFKQGQVCVGMPWVGRVVLVNLFAYARRFAEFNDKRLTFHIGNSWVWRDDKYRDYNEHNRRELLRIVDDIEKDRGRFGAAARSYLVDAGRKRQPFAALLAEEKKRGTTPSPSKHRAQDHKLVFIAGLHKSGTTILADCLKAHPQIAGFEDTGFPKDEGQFLQTLYPQAYQFDGPGRFGFRKEMHLTESSPLADPANGPRLFAEWGRYWDMKKPVLLEKSPPNLLKTRFLQALFPGAYFIVVTRHPIATSYATQKWSQTDIYSLLNHWVTCHDIFAADKPHLRKLFCLRYEDFARDPRGNLEQIYRFLDIPDHPPPGPIRSNTNEKYFARWRPLVATPHPLKRLYRRLRLGKIEKAIAPWGYSLYDLEKGNE